MCTRISVVISLCILYDDRHLSDDRVKYVNICMFYHFTRIYYCVCMFVCVFMISLHLIQHHKIYYSLLYMLICTFLFWKWEIYLPFSTIIYIFVQPKYICNFRIYNMYPCIPMKNKFTKENTIYMFSYFSPLGLELPIQIRYYKVLSAYLSINR